MKTRNYIKPLDVVIQSELRPKQPSSNDVTPNWIQKATQLLLKKQQATIEENTTTDWIVCSPGKQMMPYELVLMTSMYHSKVKHFIFKTTISMWSYLQPEVLTVLYIADLDFVTNSSDLVNLACDVGWVVAIAPATTKTGLPLIGKMFEHSAKSFQSHWYGLSNGDILHTQRLWQILRILRKGPLSDSNITFVATRRRNIYVSKALNY